MTEVFVPPASAVTSGYFAGHSDRHDRGCSDRHCDYNELRTADFYSSQAHQVEAIAKGEIATEKTGAAGQLTTEKIGAANQLTSEKIGHQVQSLIVQQANLAALQVSQNHAAAQLFACQNHAAALAAAAECCCEIKELIREEAGKTRALVQEIQATNLAVQLSDAKAEILALKASAKH